MWKCTLKQQFNEPSLRHYENKCSVYEFKCDFWVHQNGNFSHWMQSIDQFSFRFIHTHTHTKCYACTVTLPQNAHLAHLVWFDKVIEGDWKALAGTKALISSFFRWCLKWLWDIRVSKMCKCGWMCVWCYDVHHYHICFPPELLLLFLVTFLHRHYQCHRRFLPDLRLVHHFLSLSFSLSVSFIVRSLERVSHINHATANVDAHYTKNRIYRMIYRMNNMMRHAMELLFGLWHIGYRERSIR